jgi:hypothetical protein
LEFEKREALQPLAKLPLLEMVSKVYDNDDMGILPGALASMGCSPKILVCDGHCLWVQKRVYIKITSFSKRS